MSFLHGRRVLGIVVYVALALPFLISCKQLKTSETFFYGEDLILTAEGPLFEGENTAQGLIDLTEILSASDQNASLTKAALTEFVLSLPDGSSFDKFSQMTLLIVSATSEMQKVAVINPVPEDAASLSFQIAAEQDGTAALLNGDDLTFVLDFTLKEDMDDDLIFSASYKFEGITKKN